MIHLQFKGVNIVHRGGAGKTERLSLHSVLIIREYQIQLYDQETEHEINHIQASADTDLKREEEKKTPGSPGVYSWRKRFLSGFKTTNSGCLILKNVTDELRQS